jgi:citrate synthase
MDEPQGTRNGKTSTAEGAGESLDIGDNRADKEYEVEIKEGTVRAMDLRQIKIDDDDFGLMTYDPGFSNTANCRSAITYIDGEKGILQHRGIPIEQLAENSSFLEVAYLLIYGNLPHQKELDDWVYQITHHTYVHENIKDFMRGFRHDANPMGMLLASVGALSTFYPEAMDIGDEEQRHISAIRMIAKMPTLTTTSPTRATSSRCSSRWQNPATTPIPRSRRPSTHCSSCTPTTSRTPPRLPCASSAPRRLTPSRPSLPV